jgi:hypothetical protein
MFDPALLRPALRESFIKLNRFEFGECALRRDPARDLRLLLTESIDDIRQVDLPRLVPEQRNAPSRKKIPLTSRERLDDDRDHVVGRGRTILDHQMHDGLVDSFRDPVQVQGGIERREESSWWSWNRVVGGFGLLDVHGSRLGNFAAQHITAPAIEHEGKLVEKGKATNIGTHEVLPKERGEQSDCLRNRYCGTGLN